MALDLDNIKDNTIYTKKETAEILGVSVDTITYYVQTSKLDPINRQAGKHSFLGSEIKRFLKGDKRMDKNEELRNQAWDDGYDLQIILGGIKVAVGAKMKMLDFLAQNKINDFITEVMKLYTNADKKMPNTLLEIMSSEDLDKQKTLAYCFFMGLQGENRIKN